MADILIQINMPNSCAECSLAGLPVAISILGASCPWCHEIIDSKTNLRKARHPDCPLHELPEHGDLIDRDDVERIAWYMQTADDVRALQDVAKAFPVIIPSNKEETE